MCDFEKGFILCSCKIEIPKKRSNVKSKKIKNLPTQKLGYRWYLSRFVGNRTEEIDEFLIEGEYSLPSKDLGKGLSEEWIQLNLNLENCFDFEYTPQEGDNLVFRSNSDYDYLSFIFKAGYWQIEHYSPFSTILKKIDEGKIESIEKV